MELIKIVKRALQYKSPTDYYVGKMIIKELEQLNVPDKYAIVKRLEETYDDEVLVNSIKLLREDTSGEKLRDYLNLN